MTVCTLLFFLACGLYLLALYNWLCFFAVLNNLDFLTKICLLFAAADLYDFDDEKVRVFNLISYLTILCFRHL